MLDVVLQRVPLAAVQPHAAYVHAATCPTLRACPSANFITGFQQSHVASLARKLTSRCETSETAADNDNTRRAR